MYMEKGNVPSFAGNASWIPLGFPAHAGYEALQILSSVF